MRSNQQKWGRNAGKEENRDYLYHVRQFYGDNAHKYDWGEFVRRGTRGFVVQISGCKPGDRVLDVCTGTGELALTFSSNGIHVVGVDIVRNVLKYAQAKKTGSNPTWVEMDASRLAFTNKSFEVSVISLALHHMLEGFQHSVLKELARITRRKIIIIEPNAPRDRRWAFLWGAIFSLLDESEYMHQWARQDFCSTCRNAGLRVDSQYVRTQGLHRVIECTPM